MKRPLIKICGITSKHDLNFCQDKEVDLTGFIFHPSSPRYVDPVVVGQWEKKAELRVGVFVKKKPHEIMEIIKRARLDLVQLHGGQDEDFCRKIGPERVIRAFWPERYDSVKDFEKELESFTDVCRYYLLDAGTSSGGHGRGIVSPWLGDLKIVKPWLLAGGLGPDNIHKNLDRGMTGLDLNSGVEQAPGVKDHEKITQVMEILAEP
ncbi:MAG: phosphoribosylanthranilate isomerase [Desulfonatronovibrio sp.]